MNLSDKMKYRVLGRTGLKVSELGFGGHEYRRPLPTTLGKWGDINLKEFKEKQPQRTPLIEKGIEQGINYFDATQPEEAKSLGIALKELRAREDTIKQRKDHINMEVKEGKISREEGEAALEKLYADIFTPHELVILKESTSNADFHYMGSAKIMAQIGKSFAEAMVELLEER